MCSAARCDHGAPRAAAAIWRFRARAEIEAAARFSRLEGELARLGAVAPVVAMAREAARDERRHAELCAALAQRFDVSPRPRRDEAGSAAHPPPEPEALPVAPGRLGPREQLLYEVVAMSCVTETLSAALLGEMVRRATDPVARHTMQQILRDEVNHARLGWAHLAVEARRGCAGLVADYLPAMLAGTVQDELFASWSEHPAQTALSGVGALSRADRRRIFERTLRDVILPGLRRFGVETSGGERWLADKLQRSP